MYNGHTELLKALYSHRCVANYISSQVEVVSHHQTLWTQNDKVISYSALTIAVKLLESEGDVKQRV